MDFKKGQGLLKNSSIAGSSLYIQKFTDKVCTHHLATDLDTKRTYKAAFNYTMHIRDNGNKPKLYADVYSVTAKELEVYDDLIRKSVTRFRENNTFYKSNAEMFEDIIWTYIEYLADLVTYKRH